MFRTLTISADRLMRAIDKVSDAKVLTNIELIGLYSAIETAAQVNAAQASVESMERKIAQALEALEDVRDACAIGRGKGFYPTLRAEKETWRKVRAAIAALSGEA
jgi:hypothetical protein